MGDGVGHFGGPCPLPGGVDKGEQRGEAHLPDKGEGILKLLIGFAGEAHNHIGGETDVRHDAAGVADELQILLPVVAAVHLPQDPVVAGLEGQVDVMGDVLAVGHDVEQLPAGVLGMGGHEPDAVIPGDGVDAAEQLGEVHRLLQALAVGVDVLPQQGDFLVARLDKLAALLDDFLGAAALLPAPHIGYDAVGAEVVAAQHHRHPGPGSAVPAGGDAL